MPSAPPAHPPVRRLRAAAATALCAALLLAGCSGDPEPIVPEATGTASASPSASPSASAAPQPWERRTKAGAVAFVEHWVEVFNAAAASGDVGGLRQISSTTCEACQGYAEMIEDLYAQGGRLESDGWSVVQAGVAPSGDIANLSVGLQIRRSQERIIERALRELATDPPG